jgi:hypothetical protein
VIAGPQVNQDSRDRLDDCALTDADTIGSDGAIHTEAVTAS